MIANNPKAYSNCLRHAGSRLRGFESPIAVTYQVHGGGDNVPGVQTIAFNLPNDERVREAKGAKKVHLNNVLGAIMGYFGGVIDLRKMCTALLRSS